MNNQILKTVAYINRQLNLNPDSIGSYAIDHYNPGGNPYTYQLVKTMENGGISPTTRRMTKAEFIAYLDGIATGIELSQERMT